MCACDCTEVWNEEKNDFFKTTFEKSPIADGGVKVSNHRTYRIIREKCMCACDCTEVQNEEKNDLKRTTFEKSPIADRGVKVSNHRMYRIRTEKCA